MLTGMGKTFGTTGAAIAMYLTAKPENRKKSPRSLNSSRCDSRTYWDH